MVFTNNFLKLNCSFMAFMMMLSMNNSLVSAMDPVNNKLMNQVKIAFEKSESKTITFPYDQNITNFKEQKFVLPNCEFVFASGKFVEKEKFIDAKIKDRRLIKFYNMPMFLNETQGAKCARNAFIKMILDAYMDMRATVQKSFNDIAKGFYTEDAMKKIADKASKDPEFKKKVQEIAEICDELISRDKFELDNILNSMNKLSKDIENRHSNLSELKNKCNNVEKSINSHAKELKNNNIIAGVGAIGGAGVALLGGPIGWVLGGGLFIANVVLGVKNADIEKERMEDLKRELRDLEVEQKDMKALIKVNERDQKFAENQYRTKIGNFVDKFDARISMEKAFNFAMLIKNIVYFMVNKPNDVCDSNLFIMAMDYRNFYDKDKLKLVKDHNEIVDLRKDATNQEAWCDFRYVPDLKNAPRASEINGGKTINNLIEIFRTVSTNDSKNVDYNKLKKYMDGTIMPLSLVPQIVEFVTDELEYNTPRDTIVSKALKKVKRLNLGYSDDDAKEAIEKLIEKQEKILKGEGEEEIKEEEKEKKFLPQLPAAK